MDFDFKAFGLKAWEKGLYVAVKEEVVEKTTNSFDDLGLSLVDKAVRALLSIKKA